MDIALIVFGTLVVAAIIALAVVIIGSDIIGHASYRDPKSSDTISEAEKQGRCNVIAEELAEIKATLEAEHGLPV